MIACRRTAAARGAVVIGSLLAAAGGPLCAQRGDRSAADRADLPPGLPVPPAPVRSPDEERATFRLQPGFRVELVASEPLVRDPVVATFDAAGRLWVAQFETYMPDIDAGGERQPKSHVVVLHDDDGDGRMDRSAPFLSGLALPRAVLPLRAGEPGGGALVIAPPHLLWCRDRDGDLVADGTEEVTAGFDAGLENPEHSGNGLLWGIDNRIHLANDARLFRAVPQADGSLRFSVEDGAGGGQWGITQDDRGRLYFNTNSDWLRCDLVPGRYAARAPGLRMAGSNWRVVADQSVWPIRVTPGVNRGGNEGILRDGVLRRTTAVCAPLVYRGRRLAGCDGDVFVPEPAAHLVRRFRREDIDGHMRARNVHDRAEFLASTDERFRPVNTFLGPDGGLYLVDMYRGVIQHRNYVTTFLRKQVLARGLEQPIGLGRIWRIVPADVPADGDVDGVDGQVQAAAAPLPLGAAPTAVLVAALEAPEGWVRDTAQRVLVLRQDRAALGPLRALLRRGDAPASARIHALGTLDGLSFLSHDDLRAVLHGGDPGLLAFALGRAAPHLHRGDPVLRSQCEELARHPAATVRWHLALALGDVCDLACATDVGGKGGGGDREAAAWALSLLAAIAAAEPDDPVLRDCAVNAATGREAMLLRALAEREDFDARLDGHLLALGREVGQSRDAERQQELLRATAACMHTSAQRAVLRGLLAALPRDPARRAGYYVFAATPQSLPAMVATGDAEVQRLVAEVLGAVALRPEVLAKAGPADAGLTLVERGRIAAGAAVYARVCAACHQASGRGMDGLAPPLRDSEWVTGPPDRLIKIALHGVRGPIEAAGVAFDGDMPGQRYLPDEDLAAVLSWLRRAWRHGAAPVAPADVAAVRAAHGERTEAWTAAELTAAR